MLGASLRLRQKPSEMLHEIERSLQPARCRRMAKCVPAYFIIRAAA
ncbi:hypothetical protein I603_0635 [Erythrobacter dokdonensis DSW-74]|uniref:Uncharacterized protein n=1 Tax=Erythrobacter dokdonensis DSW-74 TaxID=1300349 RepID=A0A1A7BJ53_9SPHN|nr:hypothetical protein I603_0635 [Erythrobacter dokdonensis DSW-74]